MSLPGHNKKTFNDLPQSSDGCLNASSELDKLRQKNERLKEENEQLKKQIKQWKESTKKPNDNVEKLEEIIAERDDDIDTLKKEVDGQSDLSGEANAQQI
jgi:chromosome segregation ATPase